METMKKLLIAIMAAVTLFSVQGCYWGHYHDRDHYHYRDGDRDYRHHDDRDYRYRGDRHEKHDDRD